MLSGVTENLELYLGIYSFKNLLASSIFVTLLILNSVTSLLCNVSHNLSILPFAYEVDAAINSIPKVSIILWNWVVGLFLPSSCSSIVTFWDDVGKNTEYLSE